VLYRFEGGRDGAAPFAGLTANWEGALFGTTAEGRATNFGTAFKLTLCGSRNRLEMGVVSDTSAHCSNFAELK
jgi:hypothetical protein